MNVLTTLPDGRTHCLTEHEAAVLRGYLMDKREHADEADHAAIGRLLRDLDLRMRPESHFDPDLYTPDWYVPAWGKSP